jgi:ribosomal protein S19
MPSSVKKGPFIDYKLAEKIQKLNETIRKKLLKPGLVLLQFHLIL